MAQGPGTQRKSPTSTCPLLRTRVDDDKLVRPSLWQSCEEWGYHVLGPCRFFQWKVNPEVLRNREVDCTGGPRPARRQVPPKSRSGKSLGRGVGVPSLWPRPGGVLQQHGLGVSRQLDRPAQLPVGASSDHNRRFDPTHPQSYRGYRVLSVPASRCPFQQE